MTESTKQQYTHFIREATNIASLEHIEDKIKRNYGLIPAEIILEITKSRVRIQNDKIAKDDELLNAQNELINKLKCQKP